MFAAAGEVSRIDVADMHAQVAERDGRLGGPMGTAALTASRPPPS